jgi:predicted DNA-binding transcriptional regulator YafY
MYKKQIILNILDILKKYTDEEHRLSQRQIADILEKEYETKVDRKAIKSNLDNLIDLGYKIEYSTTVRMMPDKKTGELKENIVLSDFYLERDFSDSELRLLIDSLLFSQHLPYSQCRELIEKLECLSSVYFKSKVKHISTFSDSKIDNKQLFYTIDVLDEAISKGQQVSFAYLEYGADKKLHRRKEPDGTIREYIISPYQMAAKEGKYYLICNYDKYNDISNYRIDRIADVKLLETPAKPFETLDGANNRKLDLEKYMREHIYMFSSGNVRVKFRIVKIMTSDVIDMFGTDVKFSNETDTHITVSAYANEMSMLQFAKCYAPDVIVLSPQSLVNKIENDLEETLKNMKG